MKKLSIVPILGAIMISMFVAGCSGDASTSGTDTSSSTASGTTASATVKCAACSAEVAKADAVAKDGKEYCAACAGKM
jgi:Flp pilus assembly protein TadD